MNIIANIEIAPGKATLNGTAIAVENLSGNVVNDIYRGQINDYPKFFKMDGMSRLGFVASELLLKSIGGDIDEEMSIILFNRASSLATDRKYQDTIASDTEFFPSPAIFVYTLPNIVTGEISIRHKIYGETAFYVLDRYDEKLIIDIAEQSLKDNNSSMALTGWVEFENTDTFLAKLFLITK